MAFPAQGLEFFRLQAMIELEKIGNTLENILVYIDTISNDRLLDWPLRI